MYTSFRATQFNFFYESETRGRTEFLVKRGRGVQVHRREWNSTAFRNLKYGFNWSSLAAASRSELAAEPVEYLSWWNAIPMTDRSVKAYEYFKVHSANITLRYTRRLPLVKLNPPIKNYHRIVFSGEVTKLKCRREERWFRQMFFFREKWISQRCNDTSDFYFVLFSNRTTNYFLSWHVILVIAMRLRRKFERIFIYLNI